jgi:hypothetical protein
LRSCEVDQGRVAFELASARAQPLPESLLVDAGFPRDRENPSWLFFLLDPVGQQLEQHVNAGVEVDFPRAALFDLGDEGPEAIVLDFRLVASALVPGRGEKGGVEDLFLDLCVDPERFTDFVRDLRFAVPVARFVQFPEAAVDPAMIGLEERNRVGRLLPP